jgi:glycosyltransferase involved in cell wall biosynthesis
VHHGTSKIFNEDKLRFLKERNALYSVFKNYDDENLAKVFSGTLASIFNRIFTDVKFDYKKYYDFSLEQKSSSSASILMDSEPLSSLMAVKNFFDNLSILKEKRKKIQENRKRDDKAIFTYFKGQFLSVSSDLEYQKKQIDILKTLGIYEVFEKQIKRNLLIISSEVVSKQMAGPAIRVWNLASVLAEHMNVVLAVPNKTNISGQPFKVIQCANESALRELLDKCDVVLCSGMTFSKYKNIKNYERYIIIDMYDPYNLASLVEYGDETIEKQLDVHKSIHLNTNEMLYHGDFYICASERQRDFWLGMLTALNRVNPYSYNQDPVMRKLIDVVSFGLPSNKPIHTRNVIKGVVDGIGKNDFLVLWGGGIYNWFDPLILVKAMKKVSDKRKDIKLFFLGIKHPNPQVKKLALVNETVDLAKKLGIGNKNIFFNFGWVDYDERQNYFLESDAGIITHPEHIETRFAYRTRILDYLWAGLPVISTKGDVLSDMVEKEELGLTVSAGDVDELANAIILMAEKKSLYDKYKKNIGGVVSRFEWEKVCKPLIDFCLDPVPTAVRNNLKPDQVHLSSDLLEVPANKEHTNNKAKKRGTCYIARRVFYHLFKSGPKKTAIISSNYLKGN